MRFEIVRSRSKKEPFFWRIVADFEIGEVYRHDYTGERAEFIGTALMPELDGEVVGLMRWLDGTGYFETTIQS